jgi:hypothetical protein
VDPVPDPLLLRNSDSAGNRTRHLCLQPGSLTTRPQRRSEFPSHGVTLACANTTVIHPLVRDCTVPCWALTNGSVPHCYTQSVGDQPVPRALPTHRATQAPNEYIQTFGPSVGVELKRSRERNELMAGDCHCKGRRMGTGTHAICCVNNPVTRR